MEKIVNLKRLENTIQGWFIIIVILIVFSIPVNALIDEIADSETRLICRIAWIGFALILGIIYPLGLAKGDTPNAN